jgi:dihydroxy-acid dehydratase
VQEVLVLKAGYAGKKLIGSGKVLWDSRLLLAEGKINRSQFMQAVALSAPR